ncbi:MAG: NDP-sugar synthase [Elusimicrobia bacterium]|nr:NDP-sugar synthase [Elusimicrobiota bacterium]
MKAMIMAAGAGTRLRPLTYAIPKPMVPVANRPVIEYTLDNLRRHGFTEVVVNLHSHATMIADCLGDGSRWAMRLHYSHEETLLGTAGGVKKAERWLRDGPFLVTSGDGLSDVDLSKVLAFHREKRAFATMVLKPVESRFEYGVTVLDATGRIKRFVEKPHWSEVFSNTVNTGIYVFESDIFKFIPAGAPYDFGRQVWPELLKRKKRLYGYITPAYWCDVGDLNEYRRAQRDALDRKVKIALPGREIAPGIWLDEGTRIGPDRQLVPPCLIGRKCRIGRGAYVGAYTTIGDRCAVGHKAVLKNSILWGHVQVDSKVHLENCIIGFGANVTENISMYEGAVINIAE